MTENKSLLNDISITFLGVITLMIILFSQVSSKFIPPKEQPTDIEEKHIFIEKKENNLQKKKELLIRLKETYSKNKADIKNLKKILSYIKTQTRQKDIDKPETGLTILQYTTSNDFSGIFLDQHEFSRTKTSAIISALSHNPNNNILIRGIDNHPIPNWLYKVATEHNFFPPEKPLENNSY